VLGLNEREVLGSDPGAIGADYLIRDSKKVQKNQIASAPLPDYHDSKKALLERVKFLTPSVWRH
jgi:hypothetical protein